MTASQTQEIINRLKNSGSRITEKRAAIISILVGTDRPLSAFEIQDSLKRKKISANKTTVYREMAFLQTKNIVGEIRLKDAVCRYEIQTNHPNHHAVCLKCKKIQQIKLNAHLEKEEKLILRRERFNVLKHSLEFYGFCGNCKK